MRGISCAYGQKPSTSSLAPAGPQSVRLYMPRMREEGAYAVPKRIIARSSCEQARLYLHLFIAELPAPVAVATGCMEKKAWPGTPSLSALLHGSKGTGKAS